MPFAPVFGPIITVPMLLSALAGGGKPSTDRSLIGQKAPEWQVDHWMNSEPLELEDLRGKVVLIRWWTGPSCPYCTATAPSLTRFHKEYRDQGLAVIGFYHHKSRRPLDTAEVKVMADEFGFDFPVAVDPEWQTLKRYWLDRGEGSWTSVSFLIDRRGVIRYVHTGGQYVKGDEDFALMRSTIEALLEEDDE